MRRRSRKAFRIAFTIVELIVVVAIIAALAGVLLPAVQSAREAARRSTCLQNLRQVGLALSTYESAQGRYPPGARVGIYNTSGTSWFVDVLPYLGEESLYARYDKVSPHNGSVLFHPKNRRLVSDFLMPTLRCPSSPLAPLKEIGEGTARIMMPSYVGISGASSHGSFSEERVSKCCIPDIDGEISAGGILPPNDAIRTPEITDGQSKTFMVGETSSQLWGADGRRYRADGAFPAGWTMGTMANGIPPNYNYPLPVWNITTIRYAPNESDYELDGIRNDHGANNPLSSAHPNGVHIAQADGATLFITDAMDLTALKHQSTRDDGAVANVGP